MRTRTQLAILCTAFGAALAASSSALQSDPAGGYAKSAPVAASSQAAGVSIPLTGLTESSARRIEATLRAIERTAYKCETCGANHAEKGKCPTCDKDLVATVAPALKDVRVDPIKGLLSFTLEAGQPMLLTELQRTVGVDGASVNLRSLLIQNLSQLHVSAPGDPIQVQSQIKAALVDSNLLGSVRITQDAGKKLHVVTVESPSVAATHAGVVAALEAVNKEFRLVDVGWIGPCPSCVKAGRMQAGCDACWRKSTATVPASAPTGG